TGRGVSIRGTGGPLPTYPPGEHRSRCAAGSRGSGRSDDSGSQPDEVASRPHHVVFERFCLQEHVPGYHFVDERYDYLFNSYYYTVGEMYGRPRRGLLSRPTVAEIHEYRDRVDEAMLELIADRE